VLTLTLAARDAPLYGEAVARRLKLLAASLGCEAANRFT
jgi:hypothetical protein